MYIGSGGIPEQITMMSFVKTYPHRVVLIGNGYEQHSSIMTEIIHGDNMLIPSNFIKNILIITSNAISSRTFFSFICCS